MHFTLGEDIGIRLAEIARDHLMDLDVDKATEVFTESFGCDKHLAEKLAIGDLVITVDDSDNCTVNVGKRDELQEDRAKEYPHLTAKDLYRKIDSYFQTKRDEDCEYVFDDLRYLMSTVNRMYATNNEFMIDANMSKQLCRIFPSWFPNGVKIEGTIYINPRTVLAELLKLKDLNEDFEFFDFINEIDVLNIERYSDKNKLNKLMYVTLKVLEIVRDANKILKTEDFCLRNYEDASSAHQYATSRHIEVVREMLSQWMILAKNEEGKSISWDAKEADQLVEEYLEYIKS